MKTTMRRPLQFKNRAELVELVDSFNCCRYSPEEWDHQAHLALGAWYLTQLSPPQAVTAVRESIQRFNRAHIEFVTVGYHETLTLFWMSLLAARLMNHQKGDTPLKAVNMAVEAFADRSRLPFDYYSRQRLFGEAARSGWVEPDLKQRDFELVTDRLTG